MCALQTLLLSHPDSLPLLICLLTSAAEGIKHGRGVGAVLRFPEDLTSSGHVKSEAQSIFSLP